MFLKVIYGLALLDFLVVIHELGHFFAARKCGVAVEAFSIGMGPILLHKTIKNVDWRLSLLPIGGYCAMKGEGDFREAVEENRKVISTESDSLYGCNPWKSFFIGLAGPASNFFFAVFAYFLIAMIGYSYYSAGRKIILADEVYPELHSAAREAGILSGDEIILIDGKEIADFSEIFENVASKGDEDIEIVALRDGEKLSFTVHTDFDKETGTGKIGVVNDTSSIQRRESKRYSFFPAIGKGFYQTCSYIGLTFKGIRTLFRGVELKNAVSGPARITTILGDTAKEGFSVNFKTGFVSVLQLLGLISVSLFIMNLLPIPVLDGCIVLFAFIEGVFRIRIHPKIRYYSQFVGIAILAFLFLVSLYSDFSFFAGNWGQK